MWVGILLKASLMCEKSAAADENVLSYGLGVFHSAEHYPVETKFLRVARRQDFDRLSYWQGEVGLWTDTAGQGRTGSGFAALSVGVKIDLKLVHFKNSLGLAAITSPDAYLGGVFPQFTEEFTVGVDGVNGTSLGLAYKHISSAGLVNPNMGRDFLILSIGVKTW